MAAEPSKIRANTTVYWERDIPGYDASTWTASYKFLSDSLSPVNVTTTGSGTTYTVDAKPSTTGGWAAGKYAWVLFVTDGTDTFEVDNGTIEIIAETATGNDLLDAKSYLKSAEAELAARVSGKPSSYSIKDRSLSRMGEADLRKTISYWRRRAEHLQALEDNRRGKPSRKIVGARFR